MRTFFNLDIASNPLMDFAFHTKKKLNFAMPVQDKISFFTNRKKEKIEELNMGWITVYITGRTDFREEVLKKLENSDLPFMPGYTGGSTGLDTHELYWLDEKVNIREFKEVIGSKLVWKHRLRFYTSLEAFIESQNAHNTSNEFTAEERALLAEMQASFYREAS